MRWLYLALAVAGAALPFCRFSSWLGEHGPDVSRLFSELFSTRVGAFFGLDVIVTAVVLVVHEGPRRGVRHPWAPIAATLLVGPSCGLPLYLFMRETGTRRLDEPAAAAIARHRRFEIHRPAIPPATRDGMARTERRRARS